MCSDGVVAKQLARAVFVWMGTAGHLIGPSFITEKKIHCNGSKTVQLFFRKFNVVSKSLIYSLGSTVSDAKRGGKFALCARFSTWSRPFFSRFRAYSVSFHALLAE